MQDQEYQIPIRRLCLDTILCVKYLLTTLCNIKKKAFFILHSVVRRYLTHKIVSKLHLTLDEHRKKQGWKSSLQK